VSTSNALQYKIALNFFSKKCYTQKKSFLLNFSTPKKIKNPHTIHFGKFYKIFPFYFLVGFIFKFFFSGTTRGNVPADHVSCSFRQEKSLVGFYTSSRSSFQAAVID